MRKWQRVVFVPKATEMVTTSESTHYAIELSATSKN